MKVYRSPITRARFIVQVDGSEVHPKMTWPTYAGTFDSNGKLNVWTPAGYVPRGWKTSARTFLENAFEAWKAGKVTVEARRLGEHEATSQGERAVQCSRRSRSAQD